LIILANLLPVALNKYLPFADVTGRLGSVAAMLHQGDPVARHGEYFHVDVRLIPTTIYEAVVFGLAQVMPAPVASNLFLALFCVLAVPLAMLYALRSLGREPWLVVLCLPLLYQKALFCGLVNFVAAIPFVLVGVALHSKALDPDGPERLPWRSVAALAVVGVLVPFAHAFVAHYYLGLVVMLAAVGTLARARPWLLAQLGLSLVPMLVYLGVWTQGATGGRTVDIFIDQVWRAKHSLRASARYFYDWTVNNLRSRIDDLVLAGLVASFLAVLAWTSWTLRGRLHVPVRDRLRRAGWELRLPLLLLATAVLYYLLPFEVHRPVYWWGVSVRMVPFLWLLAILCLPRCPRPLPIATLLPAALAALLHGAYLTYDFRAWFNGVEMAGLDRAVDVIPRGKRVLGLFPHFTDDPRYTHPSLFFVATTYVVRRGGYAYPAMEWDPEHHWVGPRDPPPAPLMGMARRFRWELHGRDWDYLMVKDPPPGQRRDVDPLAQVPPGALTLVAHHGLWRLYGTSRRRGPAP
jgi:hypothetical protein